VRAGFEERGFESTIDDRLSLLVFGAAARRHALPDAGEVVIGRSEDADVRIDDLSVSRMHARLSIGEELLLEDLGSQNGTRCRSHLLEAGQKIEIGAGLTFLVGSTMLVVQGRVPRFFSAEAEPIDPTMLRLHALIERIASEDVSVLLLGETGVGKETLAELLHAKSSRRDRPFVKLNAATFDLLESASGGTAFIDELGDLPHSVQRQLNRAMSLDLDVRFVTATSRDLRAEIARGVLRLDLLRRLSGISLVVPRCTRAVRADPSSDRSRGSAPSTRG
jgi:two-component system, NtrC family, response regulator AtoC